MAARKIRKRYMTNAEVTEAMSHVVSAVLTLIAMGGDEMSKAVRAETFEGLCKAVDVLVAQDFADKEQH